MKNKIELVEYLQLDDLLLNDEFINMVKKNDQKKEKELIRIYPEKKKLINEAILLIRYIQIDYTNELSTKKKKEDWTFIKEQIRYKSKTNKFKRRRLYITSMAAASIIIILMLAIKIQGLEKESNKQTMITLNSKIQINEKEIFLKAGKQKTFIENDKTITQTDKGDITVDNEKQLSSEEIQTEYLTLTVPNGKRTNVVFSDGTKIWVNSGTKLVYPKVFKKNIREIVIDGEAYLEVAKDAKSPFKIYTNGLDIEVLGTAFNICSYSSDRLSSVVLVNGSIKVKAEKYMGTLKPNQGFFLSEHHAQTKTVNIEPYISWKEGYLLLQNTSLDEIMLRLSRFYGVTIQLEPSLKNEKFRGKLILSTSIEEVLNNISISTGVQYERSNDQILINK